VPAGRIVALGGGTGLPVVLGGLKAALFSADRRRSAAVDPGRLTAVVTVADDGGSSGRLCEAFAVLPPGDLRNCLVALAAGNPQLAEIFNFRFGCGGEPAFAGHTVGNLILTALSQREGDFFKALSVASDLLGIRGRALPVSREGVRLAAEFCGGGRAYGESRIPAVGRRIRRVWLEPPTARACAAAVEAVEAADLIAIGPGSLYTSLVPVLLFPEIADAIDRSGARVVLIANLMTQAGETTGYSAADHLRVIRQHAPQVPIHDVLVNTTPLPGDLAAHHAAEGAFPTPIDVEAVRELGCRVRGADLLADGDVARHDARKVAAALLGLLAEGL